MEPGMSKDPGRLEHGPPAGASFDSLLDLLLETALDIVGAPRGSIMLVDPGGLNLQLRSSRGLPPQARDGAAHPLAGSLAGQALSKGSPLHLDHAINSSRGIHESLIVPLMQDRAAIGTLNLSRTGGDAWSERQRDSAIRFARGAAWMIDVMRRGGDKERRLNELDRSLAFTRIFASTRELSKIVELLLGCAREITGAPRSFVTVFDQTGAQYASYAGHNIPADVLDRLIGRLSESFGHDFFVNTEPMSCSRLGQLDPGHPLRVLDVEKLATHVVVVPLVFGYRIVGRLYLMDVDTGMASEETLRSLALLSQEAAIAIDQGRVFWELKDLAFTDPLTRLCNRNYWMQRFEEEIIRSRRQEMPLSMVMIDIDHFKVYNDTYGHQVGDEVLKMVARVVSGCLREVDVVGRYGGEEFGILLPDTDENGANYVAERIRSSVIELELGQRIPLPGEGTATHPPDRGLTISLGCYTSHGSRRESAADIIRAADTALLYSKARGRNRVSVYSPEGVRPGSPSPAEPKRGKDGSARLASSSEFLFRMADSLTRTRLDPAADNARFGFNILIAGGPAADSLMLERLFTELGYNTLLRNSGGRALAAARRQPLDLVILDLELKDLDGMELLHALKERDPYLPVIVLSEREHMQNAINAVREGADDYILKPFGVEEIRASVDTAFSKRIRIMKERQDGSPRESTLTLDVERISEQARREFASGARDLRLLEEFNRRSIENLMHGVLLLDSDFHVIHLNRLAMEMAGVSRPEGEPVHIAQLAPLLADSRLMTALEQVRAGQETVVLNDFWLQDPGGGTRGLHKVIVQHTPLVDDEFLLVQVENILDSRLLREETRKVRMQVARQIYGRVAQHLQVIAGRGELLQLRDEHSHGNLQQILDASREIGRILTELGTDMHETEEGEAG